jgi:hypothetical protein
VKIGEITEGCEGFKQVRTSIGITTLCVVFCCILICCLSMSSYPTFYIRNVGLQRRSRDGARPIGLWQPRPGEWDGWVGGTARIWDLQFQFLPLYMHAQTHFLVLINHSVFHLYSQPSPTKMRSHDQPRRVAVTLLLASILLICMSSPLSPLLV